MSVINQTKKYVVEVRIYIYIHTDIQYFCKTLRIHLEGEKYYQRQQSEVKPTFLKLYKAGISKLDKKVDLVS